ncbi:MAG: SPOR domain-containing protein [Salinivirgaceae bacterium]|nr:SPOR domain-containing protein [Salinivirgaceae bacterium]
MLDLSDYIIGLLFINDCVILPGFGGFVANYQEAQHDATSNTFTPPSKKLVFNSNLSYNDGLLINHLSQQLSVSYAEAKEMVRQSVEDVWIRLERGEVVKFDGIGSFQYGEGDALVFNPEITENLLTDSYGMFSFRFPPLSYKTSDEPIINNDNIRHMPNLSSRQILSYAAILVPIAVLIALIPIYRNADSQSASVIPIEDTVTATVPKSSVDNAITESTDKRRALFYSETPAQKVEVHKASNTDCTYYIIGGSFKDKANAESYMKKYRKDGFDSGIVHADNLYRVTLGSFDDKVFALHELRRIRASEKYSNAWLYPVAK